MKVEIINQPYSGEYQEKIYDIESVWNSKFWSWIKMTNKDLEIVGQFRGSANKVKCSESLNEMIVLTSDFIYRLEGNNFEISEWERQPQYHDLEVSPNGDFILHDYYNIYKMDGEFSKMINIEGPVQMDDIKFIKWENNKLYFEFEEIGNWEEKRLMYLDTSTWKIQSL